MAGERVEDRGDALRLALFVQPAIERRKPRRHLLALHPSEDGDADVAIGVGQHAIERLVDRRRALPVYRVRGTGRRAISPVDPGARFSADARERLGILAPSPRIVGAFQTIEQTVDDCFRGAIGDRP